MTVYFTDKAWREMTALARLAKQEMSGWGYTYIDDDHDIVCSRIGLQKQWGTPASTHLDMTALGNFMAKAVRRNPDDASHWNLWWHSHPGGGKPAFSSVDYDTLEQRASVHGIDYYVGVVVSGDGNSAHAYIAVRQPFWVLVEADVARLPTPAEQRLEDWLAVRQERVDEWAEAQIKTHVVQPPLPDKPMRMLQPLLHAGTQPGVATELDRVWSLWGGVRWSGDDA